MTVAVNRSVSCPDCRIALANAVARKLLMYGEVALDVETNGRTSFCGRRISIRTIQSRLFQKIYVSEVYLPVEAGWKTFVVLTTNKPFAELEELLNKNKSIDHPLGGQQHLER